VGCVLATGVGEAPIFRQATFTIWENIEAMEAFSKTGAHMEAVKSAMAERHFTESQFSRFIPTEMKGTYKGRVFE
jgi:heme-degrading monooxygenase HmoA